MDNIKFESREFANGTKGDVVVLKEPYYKSGFNFFCYVMGAPSTIPSFKLDIYCNFECLPNAKFLNYLPLSISPYHISDQEKKKYNLFIQEKPIMKLNEERKIIKYVSSIWDKLYNSLNY